jgi:hypothetical protein
VCCRADDNAYLVSDSAWTCPAGCKVRQVIVVGRSFLYGRDGRDTYDTLRSNFRGARVLFNGLGAFNALGTTEDNFRRVVVNAFLRLTAPDVEAGVEGAAETCDSNLPFCPTPAPVRATSAPASAPSTPCPTTAFATARRGRTSASRSHCTGSVG